MYPIHALCYCVALLTSFGVGAGGERGRGGADAEKHFFGHGRARGGGKKSAARAQHGKWMRGPHRGHTHYKPIAELIDQLNR